jgi:hypothetical protein
VLSHATGVASVQAIKKASNDMVAMWMEAGEAVVAVTTIIANLDSDEETIDK